MTITEMTEEGQEAEAHVEEDEAEAQDADAKDHTQDPAHDHLKEIEMRRDHAVIPGMRIAPSLDQDLVQPAQLLDHLQDLVQDHHHQKMNMEKKRSRMKEVVAQRRSRLV